MKEFIKKLYRTWSATPALDHDSRTACLYKRSIAALPHKVFSNLI